MVSEWTGKDRPSEWCMLAGRRPYRLGIYVHFPYCIQKCTYCDFYSVGLNQLKQDQSPTQVTAHQLQDYQKAIQQEWAQRLVHFQKPELPAFTLDSIFFGGGTASLMPPTLIADLLDLFRREFDLAPEIEITLEGNPEDFTPNYLNAIADAGINRINAGLQTFQANFLHSMQRYYNAERYASILSDLSAAPIPARGIDLIYGFAGQTWRQFEADLKEVLGYSLNHLSLYSLTLEKATPYATAVQRGLQSGPSEDLQLEIYAALPDILSSQGFEQYEVSNYARPGFASRHNLRYWYYEPCLALGPGAHGFDGLQRYANSRSISHWQTNPASATYEIADPKVEFPLGYLRLSGSLRISDFISALTGIAAPDQIKAIVHKQFKQWISQSLLIQTDFDSYSWSMAGQLQLDTHIFEMCTALESLAKS